MKHIFNISFIVILVSAILAGCNKFLETESYTEKNTGNFPVNESDVYQLLTGTYSALNSAVSEPSAAGWMCAMIASDECYGGGGGNDYDSQSFDHLLYANVDVHAKYWKTYYQGITRANMTIDNIELVKDEELRNQYLGEALFLRSYFLFELTTTFGEIPLTYHAVENVDQTTAYPPQAPIEKVYGTIAAGLKKAIEIMPSKPWYSCISGLRHATKWDAEGMLARVYLFYTGFYSDKDSKSITELPLIDLTTTELIQETVNKEYVIKCLEDCINNSGHKLVEDFRLLWPYTNSATAPDFPDDYLADLVEKGTYWYTDDKNPEEMFSICCTNLSESTLFGNRYDRYLGVRQRTHYETNAFPFSEGYGWAPVNPAVLTDWGWDEKDLRKKASIYSFVDDPHYTKGNDGQVEESCYWQMKYQGWGAMVDGKFIFEFSSVSEYGGNGSDLGGNHSPQNIMILRFADILLMHSELTETADGMNKVRARAGLDPISYSPEALRLERKFELAFEGIRWNDMRRYGKAYCIDALKTQLGQKIWNYGQETVMKDQGVGYEARYNATYGFRLFPNSEIILSAGVLKQNDGWTDASAQYTSWK